MADITNALWRLADLHAAMGLPPLATLPSPWVVEIGDWTVSVEAASATATITNRHYLGAIVATPTGAQVAGLQGVTGEFMAALDARIEEVIRG